MRGPRTFVTVWLGLALLVSGCVSSGNPSVVDQDRISQIKLNISAKKDVKRILGQPNSISQQSGRYSAFPGLPASTAMTNVEVWSYAHMSVAVNVATFIPIVGLFAGGATSNINTFSVVFDEQGIVRYISSTQSQGHSGLGAGRESTPTKPLEYTNPSSRPAPLASDDSDAARYEKSAAMGIADSQYNLGRLYANGQGVPQDYAKARQWYEKAAAQGNAGAQKYLGLLYGIGQGVPLDYVQAHMWWNLAAGNGYEAATGYRDDLARQMTPAQIAEAQKLAREWNPKTNEQRPPP